MSTLPNLLKRNLSKLPSSSLNNTNTHYLVTLLRSPLHLPASSTATANSIGLRHRHESSLIPISAENAGYLLKLKELIAVRAVTLNEFKKVLSPEWRNREGEGRRGSGTKLKGGMMEGRSKGVVRIGSERCRGSERGFKVVER